MMALGKAQKITLGLPKRDAFRPSADNRTVTAVQALSPGVSTPDRSLVLMQVLELFKRLMEEIVLQP